MSLLLALTGSSGSTGVTGVVAAQETGADTLASAGDVFISGVVAAQETGADIFVSVGTVTAAPVVGALAVQEAGADTLTAAGDVFVSGAVSVSESGSDTLSATNTVSNTQDTRGGRLNLRRTSGAVVTVLHSRNTTSARMLRATGQAAPVVQSGGAYAVGGRLSTRGACVGLRAESHVKVLRSKTYTLAHAAAAVAGANVTVGGAKTESRSAPLNTRGGVRVSVQSVTALTMGDRVRC